MLVGIGARVPNLGTEQHLVPFIVPASDVAEDGGIMRSQCNSIESNSKVGREMQEEFTGRHWLVGWLSKTGAASTIVVIVVLLLLRFQI